MTASPRHRSRTWLWILGGLCLATGVTYGACSLRSRKPAAEASKPHPEAIRVGVEALDFPPKIEEGSLPLASASNAEQLLKAFKISLSQEQRAFLETNKFVLVPLAGTKLAGTTNYDEMLAAFDSVGGDAASEMRVPENAKLVTPDIALHAFHKFFSMTQEELEKAELRAQLKLFLTGLLNAAAEAQKTVPSAARGYARVQAQMAVALVLLENQGPPAPGYFENPEAEQAFIEADKDADSLANAQRQLAALSPALSPEFLTQANEELALIYGAASVVPSPLFGGYDPTALADYTQFTPRSYYAKSSGLRAYFRSMMFLGRNGYVLKEDAGLTDALLLSGLFTRKDTSGRPLSEDWQRIMDVTALYAGPSDDLTYSEWTSFLKEVGGSQEPTPESATDPTFLARLHSNVEKLPPPRIQSDLTADRAKVGQPLPQRLRDAAAFRIFGQRFTYDAWVINQITNERVTDEWKRPATALYGPAALGDTRALVYAGARVAEDPHFGQEGGARVQQDLEALEKELQSESEDRWHSSMSASWLELLGTLTRSYGPGFPRYMQAEPFGDKQLQTFLGSYTELKHDTLLYAKQSYAEMGEGGDGPIPPVVKGFVEPNLHFWAKLAALLQRTQTFFEREGLFKEGVVRERLQEFRRNVDFYQQLAVKELRALPISEDEYESLRTLNLSYLAEPLAGLAEVTDETGKVSLVADIHTDGKRGMVLYEGTGRPYLMLALVGNDASPRLTVGLAFNHVEFTRPLEGARLTDEAWRASAYASPPNLPAKNAWYRHLAIK